MGASPTAFAALRKSYERDSLDEDDAPDDPLTLFERWIEQAVKGQLPEPNSMTLATVGADGRPSTRVVLIKGFDARGIVWYTNYESRKGRELAHQPFAALQFHWVELERVVRIEGRVELTGSEESDAYYRSRPLDALGWLPAAARPLGVLAGPPQPPARPACVRAPRRHGLDARAARTLRACQPGMLRERASMRCRRVTPHR